MAANTETLFRSREAPSWRARKTLDASEPVHLLRAIGAGECNKGGKILRVAGGGVTPPAEREKKKGDLFFNMRLLVLEYTYNVRTRILLRG